MDDLGMAWTFTWQVISHLQKDGLTNNFLPVSHKLSLSQLYNHFNKAVTLKF